MAAWTALAVVAAASVVCAVLKAAAKLARNGSIATWLMMLVRSAWTWPAETASAGFWPRFVSRGAQRGQRVDQSRIGGQGFRRDRCILDRRHARHGDQYGNRHRLGVRAVRRREGRADRRIERGI